MAKSTKFCTKCKKAKNLECFSFQNKEEDVKMNWCKDELV